MSEIRIAYLLVAHKCPEQVNMFIKQLLDYGDCDVYVHVDKKNTELLNDIIEFPRVYKYSVYDVRWGSFEIVKAALYLMRKAIESGRTYSHMYFGSGQDLLVKRGLYEYLQLNSNKIFLRIVGEIKNTNRESARYRVCWPHKLMIRNDLHPYRFLRIFIQLLCKMGIVIKKNKKVLNKKVHFYEGRTWFIAPYEVIEYIINYVAENPDFIDYWEDSLASDLMFFQTIIMNSSFAKNVEDELMYVNFGKTFGTMNHPLTITMHDINTINSGNYFFARKFELEEDMQTINYYLKLVGTNDES